MAGHDVSATRERDLDEFSPKFDNLFDTVVYIESGVYFLLELFTDLCVRSLKAHIYIRKEERKLDLEETFSIWRESTTLSTALALFREPKYTLCTSQNSHKDPLDSGGRARARNDRASETACDSQSGSKATNPVSKLQAQRGGAGERERDLLRREISLHETSFSTIKKPRDCALFLFAKLSSAYWRRFSRKPRTRYGEVPAPRSCWWLCASSASARTKGTCGHQHRQTTTRVLAISLS